MSFKERTEIIFGPEKMDLLAGSSVAVYGLGGVGAVAAVTLVRAGIGKIMVTDFDAVNESNLNRLIFGFNSTVGMNKTEVFKKTALDINPDVEIEVSSAFMHGADAAFNIHKADFHIDAIDSLNPKVNLIIALLESDQLFISSMGTGGRVRPEMLQIADIWKTDVCPLAKFVRKRLRNRNVKKGFPVVFSKEISVDPVDPDDDDAPDVGSGRKRLTQGSAPFVPQAAGLVLASFAVRKIIEGGIK